MNADNISQILDEIAARFGTTGARLWEQLVRYEVATAVAEAIIMPLICLAAFKAAQYLFKQAEDADEYDTKPFLQVVGSVFSAVFAITLVMSLVSFIYVAGALVAPEAATLKSLLP